MKLQNIAQYSYRKFPKIDIVKRIPEDDRTAPIKSCSSFQKFLRSVTKESVLGQGREEWSVFLGLFLEGVKQENIYHVWRDEVVDIATSGGRLEARRRLGAALWLIQVGLESIDPRCDLKIDQPAIIIGGFRLGGGEIATVYFFWINDPEDEGGGWWCFNCATDLWWGNAGNVLMDFACIDIENPPIL